MEKRTVAYTGDHISQKKEFMENEVNLSTDADVDKIEIASESSVSPQEKRMDGTMNLTQVIISTFVHM